MTPSKNGKPGPIVHSVWLSILQALRNWRTITWLVPAAMGAAKQIGLIETAYIPPSWVWWSVAIVVLLINNVSLTYKLQIRGYDRADLPAVTAFKLILCRSRRAAELVRRRDELLNIPGPLEHHFTEVGIVEERLKRRLRDEIHDALRQGRIKAWGTPSSGGPEIKIEPEEWSKFEIAFDDQELNSVPYPIGGVNQLAAWQRKTDPRSLVRVYVNVQFSKQDIVTEFPLRLLPRRIDFVPLLKNSQDVIHPEHF